MDLSEIENRLDDLVAEISGVVESLKKDVDYAFDGLIDRLKTLSCDVADMATQPIKTEDESTQAKEE